MNTDVSERSLLDGRNAMSAIGQGVSVIGNMPFAKSPRFLGFVA